MPTRVNTSIANWLESNIESYDIRVPVRALIEAHNGAITPGEFLFLQFLCAVNPINSNEYTGLRF